MTANNHLETENSTDKKGEVRPLAGKDGKLEDKIADEKDDDLGGESATEERRRDSGSGRAKAAMAKVCGGAKVLINREVLTQELHELDTRIALNAQRQSDIFARLKGVGTSIAPEELAGLNEEMEILQGRRLIVIKELRALPEGGLTYLAVLAMLYRVWILGRERIPEILESADSNVTRRMRNCS